MVTNEVRGAGREAITGYVDPNNESKAAAGEKRIYARDENGVEVAEIWLKNTGEATISNGNGSTTLRPDGGSAITTPASTFDAAADGSIKGDNGNGSFELAVNGDFLVNGVTIKANGDVIFPNSLVLNGKEIDDHDHDYSWTDPAGAGTTGGNN